MKVVIKMKDIILTSETCINSGKYSHMTDANLSNEYNAIFKNTEAADPDDAWRIKVAKTAIEIQMVDRNMVTRPNGPQAHPYGCLQQEDLITEPAIRLLEAIIAHEAKKIEDEIEAYRKLPQPTM